MDAERIFTRYGAEMLRHAQLMLRRDALAEDAVQEVLLKAMRARPVFADERLERAWLLCVTGNVCRDFLRRARRRGETPVPNWPDIPADGPLPEEEALRRERDGRLLRAVLALPVRCREAVLMVYYHEMTDREAAQALGVSGVALRSRLTRARKLLRRALGEEVLP